LFCKQTDENADKKTKYNVKGKMNF